MKDLQPKKLREGITLIETVLYLGIVSVLLTIISQFMLSVLEFDAVAERRNEMSRITVFLTEHLKYNIDNAVAVNQGESVFDNSESKLVLETTGADFTYEVVANILEANSVVLHSTEYFIDEFRVLPVFNKDSELVALRVTIDINDVKFDWNRREVETLYLI